MKTIKKLVFALIIFLIIFTFYIIIADYFNSACLIDDSKSCSAIQDSPYGKILGVKVSWIGLFSFAILLVFYSLSNVNHKEKKDFQNYFIIFVALGALFAGYLLYIQFIILREACTNCLVIDFVMIALFIISAIDYYKEISSPAYFYRR